LVASDWPDGKTGKRFAKATVLADILNCAIREVGLEAMHRSGRNGSPLGGHGTRGRLPLF